ncbi:unnamed protein product [Sphagnum tenellum]
MEQQRGQRGAARTGDVDHTIAAVLLSPAGTNKDGHPHQEADCQEVAASVILHKHGLGTDVSHDAIGGQNLRMNVAIAYKENGVLSNVQSRPGHLKCCKSEVMIYVENDEPYNKWQHLHNLLLAMTHYNCFETKTR